MPEGDTLFRAATVLRKALLGQVVTGFETSVDTARAVASDHPVEGRTITGVEARGKHLLITLALPTPNTQHPTPTLVLHTHLRMTGSWHLYRPGEPWRKPERYAKVVLRTTDWVAPCFSAPVVGLLTERRAARHAQLQALGPDAMTEEFDREDALARLRRHPDVEIGVALMNQRLMAGVGNVYKSEVLFVRRVCPFSRVGELADEALEELVDEAHRLMRLNEARGARRTMFGLRESERLWVYGRSGEPCRVCGETVRMRRQGMDARSTYYCPQCQAGRGTE
jgi:endonuclease-8